VRPFCSIAILLFLNPLSLGAYNPQNDPACRAWWRMESGAITTDSSGEDNTLTNNNSTPSSATCKEGSASANFDGIDQSLSIADASLSTDFPLKSGDATKDISLCFWIRFDALPETSQEADLWCKYDDTGDNRSLAVAAYNSAGTTKFYGFFGYNNGESVDAVLFDAAISAETWYHVTVTHEGSTRDYRIRIWDDTAQEQLAADKTGSLTNELSVRSAGVSIGCRSDGESFPLDGLIDDVLVFDDVLTVSEIDQIRAQTYDPGYEDFTDGWTHVDEYNKLNVTATSLVNPAGASAKEEEGATHTKSYGAGQFGDFSWQWYGLADASWTSYTAWFMGAANEAGYWPGVVDAGDSLWVRVHCEASAGNQAANIYSVDDGAGTNSDDISIPTELTNYYFRFSRSGTTATLTVWTGGFEDTLVGTVNLATTNTTFQYCHAYNVRNDNAGNVHWDLYNLDLAGAGEEGPYVGLLKPTLNNPVLHGDTLSGGLYE